MLVTITNLSAAEVYLPGYYVTIPVAGSVTTHRNWADLDRDQILKTLVQANTVSLAFTKESGDDAGLSFGPTTPSYDNIDARLNWKTADDLLGITLWVRNLTDEDQNTSVAANGFRNEDNGRYQTFSYTPPRMWGVDLLVHY